MSSTAKFKIGDKVKLTKAWAEWNLEHPECWENPRTGAIDDFKNFETTMQLAMLVLLEAPIVGTVVSEATPTTVSRVKFPRYKTERVDEGDLLPANLAEVEIDLSGKALKTLNRISKASGVPIAQVLSVLIAHAHITGRLKNASNS